MTSGDNSASDRRNLWQLKSRPEWLARLNSLAPMVDTRGIVPLDEESLLEHARRAAGLVNFDDADGWRAHFRVLLRFIEEEAKLNFFGRLLTRADLLIFLGTRLMVTEAYRKHPEINDQVITEPVFILGFGRSGTTILHETLSRDPQFRSVRRWEAMYPWPAPEEATYETDARIAKAQGHVDFVHAASPEWRTMHAWGGDLPVEDIEFTYGAFMSEVWTTAYQMPSYESYFAKQDVSYHFAWHKRVLKLLQWKFRRPHWLLKNPTHMPRIPQLLQAYPDAKIIFPHRDPITSTDSVINVGGTIFSWRTDDPYGGGCGDEWVLAEPRAKMWEDVIGWIESGSLANGAYANVLYDSFLRSPKQVIESVYRDLGLTLRPEVLASMLAFLNERQRGTHGNTQSYAKTAPDDPVRARERAIYKRYQDYFGVPNES